MCAAESLNDLTQPTVGRVDGEAAAELVPPDHVRLVHDVVRRDNHHRVVRHDLIGQLIHHRDLALLTQLLRE